MNMLNVQFEKKMSFNFEYPVLPSINYYFFWFDSFVINFIKTVQKVSPFQNSYSIIANQFQSMKMADNNNYRKLLVFH